MQQAFNAVAKFLGHFDRRDVVGEVEQIGEGGGIGGVGRVRLAATAASNLIRDHELASAEVNL